MKRYFSNLYKQQEFHCDNFKKIYEVNHTAINQIGNIRLYGIPKIYDKTLEQKIVEQVFQQDHSQISIIQTDNEKYLKIQKDNELKFDNQILKNYNIDIDEFFQNQEQNMDQTQEIVSLLYENILSTETQNDYPLINDIFIMEFLKNNELYFGGLSSFQNSQILCQNLSVEKIDEIFHDLITQLKESPLNDMKTLANILYGDLFVTPKDLQILGVLNKINKDQNISLYLEVPHYFSIQQRLRNNEQFNLNDLKLEQNQEYYQKMAALSIIFNQKFSDLENNQDYIEYLKNYIKYLKK